MKGQLKIFRSRRKFIKKTVLVSIMYPLAFIINFPLIWMVITSFKSSQELYTVPPTLLPQQFTLAHYAQLFKLHNFLTQFRNSIVVAVTVCILTLIIATIASYSLTRFKFKFVKAYSNTNMIFYMVPSVLLVIPLFLFLARIGIGDTLLSLILVYLTFNLPFGTLLMRSYLVGVPPELEESAMIDGCTRFKAFLKVVIPAVLPGMISTFIFTFILSWSEFLYAFTMLHNPANFTLPVGIALLLGRAGAYSWGVVNASGVMIMIPVLIMFSIVQKQLIAGFSVGAIKG